VSGGAQIAIVDYGMGNRRSVQKALEHVGAQAELTSDPRRLSVADGLVLPGVGAFPKAMENLGELGLIEFLRDQVAAGRPLLGICLGMQLLFERSEEFTTTEGLGLIPGRVTGLQAGGLRVPHIGWNEVRFERPSALTAGLPSAACAFYHVHSLVARPERSQDVLATTEYGERFATIVGRGPVVGVQFHPEKSSVDGLRLLANFVGMCGEPASAEAKTAALRT
jgi:glutamine amidotransferase